MHPIVKVMEAAGALAAQDIREAILTFQEGIRQVSVGREGFPLRHEYVGNVYAREITMPAGATVVGEIHRHAHLNFIMCGVVRVLTEHDGCQELRGPCMFVSKPGTKRLVHVLEDCVWVTVHEVSVQDHEKAEGEIIAKDYADIELSAEFKRL